MQLILQNLIWQSLQSTRTHRTLSCSSRRLIIELMDCPRSRISKMRDPYTIELWWRRLCGTEGIPMTQKKAPWSILTTQMSPVSLAALLTSVQAPKCPVTQKYSPKSLRHPQAKLWVTRLTLKTSVKIAVDKHRHHNRHTKSLRRYREGQREMRMLK